MLLLEHYEIAPTDPLCWLKLAWRLAIDNVPGFRVSENPRGRGRPRKPSSLRQLAPKRKRGRPRASLPDKAGPVDKPYRWAYQRSPCFPAGGSLGKGYSRASMRLQATPSEPMTEPIAITQKNSIDEYPRSLVRNTSPPLPRHSHLYRNRGQGGER